MLRLRNDKNYTLYKWIILSCITLMIPILCAVINIVINNKLIAREVNKANNFMLQNIQYNIDDRLSDILEVSNYYLMNTDFNVYSLNVDNPQLFKERVNKCFNIMNLSHISNSNIETLLYLTNKDYIISSTTANSTPYIYGSLVSQNKLDMSLEEWKNKLTQQNKNRFTIDNSMGYLNAGEESIVYSAGMLYTNINEPDYLVISMQTDFIDIIMNEKINMENTILILDENNNIIGQYGKEINIENAEIILPRKSRETFEIEIDNTKYISSYINSDISKWKYVICTPKWVFLKDINRNLQFNTIIIFIGVIISIITMIILQRKNYKPVQKLIEILPEQEGEDYGLDNLLVFEKKLRKLYDENILMQNSIEKRSGYDKELALLLAIKGRKNYLTNMSVEELIGEDYKFKKFIFVTTRLDFDDIDGVLERTMDHNLLAFLVDNIVTDVLGTEFKYLKTIDDSHLVFLFTLEKDNCKKWDNIFLEKFLFIDDFLQNRLNLELAITLGSVFDNFENVVSAYTKIEEVNERRYYTKPYGVVRVDEMPNIDFSSLERLLYYSKWFEEIANKADLNEAKDMSNELFNELLASDKQFNTILYYILSIVNNVLMFTDNGIIDNSSYINSLDEILSNIRKCESTSALQEEFYRLIKLICNDVELDTTDLSLSEKIKTYVKENYIDYNMNISSIADTIGLTPRYMSKIFKEQTNVNLLTYINDVRIEHAKELLKTTDKTVDQISELTGFSNVRTFRRNFQKATGVTAIGYRNS